MKLNLSGSNSRRPSSISNFLFVFNYMIIHSKGIRLIFLASNHIRSSGGTDVVAQCGDKKSLTENERHEMGITPASVLHLRHLLSSISAAASWPRNDLWRV
ncbi:unnamed protein product [Cuscuta epithymum]|uniref:Uncharacterized protein n=1 Tax=Cuscuta epithymum TaxID=186058 RepID=A0AAV0DZX5_9ASTE|nr:unnamed protein product [Cuscuta epithymum]